MLWSTRFASSSQEMAQILLLLALPWPLHTHTAWLIVYVQRGPCLAVHTPAKSALQATTTTQ